MNINQDVLRVIKPYIDEAIAKAIGGITKGSGESLPTSADFVGQLFLKTGDGLYVSTGTTTPAWKAITLAE